MKGEIGKGSELGGFSNSLGKKRWILDKFKFFVVIEGVLLGNMDLVYEELVLKFEEVLELLSRGRRDGVD